MKTVLSPFRYIFEGLLVIIKIIFSFIKYVFLGIVALMTTLVKLFAKDKKDKVTINSQKTENIYKKTDILLAQHEQEKALKKQKEEETRQKLQEKEEKKAQRRLNDYIQDSSKLEDKTASEKLDQFGTEVLSFSDKIKNVLGLGQIKDKYQNAEEMTVNYEGPEAQKTKEKQTYEYIIRNPEGKVIKGYFSAFSLVEVHSYLKSQGNIVYSIRTNRWINAMYGSVGGSHDKFKTKDLIFFLAQVSTYLKVGMPLAEAINILSKQFKNKKYKLILSTLIYDLSIGKSFSLALE